MECAVYDTYVKRKDGKIMHFDVVVEASTPHEKAIEYGKKYLAGVGQDGQKMTQEECQFCHVQEAPPMVQRDIESTGYYIQKMDTPIFLQNSMMSHCLIFYLLWV
jgi:hypothetical protein